MIKDLLINTERRSAIAILDIHGAAINIYCDTHNLPPDGGEAFLEAARNYSGPPGFLLYFADGAIHDAGMSPSPHHIFDYVTKQWVDPRTEQTQWPVVRSQRNALLSASDWTQLPDVPLATKESWATYRQALRDVTLQSDPFVITWPALPGQ